MNKVIDINGTEIDFDAAVNLMDDEIRERLHDRGIEAEQEFLKAYAAEHEAAFGEEFAPWVGGNW